MSIKPLPRDAIDKIKSSVAITTLDGAIIGLLKNSLDASATKAYVTLDYAKGDCSLEDNGHGIPPEEFGEAGGLGKLHHTSRQPPSSDLHGRRGDFIAALAGLSLLSVTSKHINHRTQNAVIIHNGQVIARRCPAALEQHITTFDNGTRIMVRDLFGALPVRVKQRARTSFDKNATQKQWLSLVRDVLALLLAWPTGVLVVMRSNADGRELRLKSPPATIGYTSRASTLLMQASLVDYLDESCWIPVSSSSRTVTVSGCISLCPLPTRQAQFLTFGIQPVDSSCGTNVLFEEINRVFRNSSFGSSDDPAPSSQIDDSLKAVQGRRSGPSQHPMFYLRIDLNSGAEIQASEDSLFETDHRLLQVIIDVLRAICYGFLKRHHMRPQKITRSSDRSLLSTARQLGHSNRRKPSTDTSVGKFSGPSPSLNTSGRPSSPFDSWNRLKSGVASKSRLKSLEGHMEFSKQRLIGPGGMVLRRPFQEYASTSSEVISSHSCAYDKTDLGQAGDSKSQSQTQLSAPENDSNPPTQWLADLMRSWKNPVFENVEPAVPTAHGNWSSKPGECSHHWSNDDLDNAISDSASVGFRNRLHRDALVSAQVIDQVDNKFILVKLPSLIDIKRGQETPTTLVMLDQHAVDERCRLEDLLANYFSKSSTGAYIARSEALDKTIVFDISAQEAELLEHYQEHFLIWGVVYAVQRSKCQGRGTSSKCLVKVNSLPLSITERCRTEPRLLINLLRDEIWHLNDGGLASKPRTSPSSDSQHPWVGLFRGCPRGILDLLHSRSCRSAIMFNDSLTKQDCAELLERLSRCAFPFQCAHGRPSMAPILDMGTEPRVGAWTDEGTNETRVSAWKTWMHT